MELDRTHVFRKTSMPTGIAAQLSVAIFDGELSQSAGAKPIRIVRLNDYRKSIVTFGRAETNDIVLHSPLVSSTHGRFRMTDGKWIIEDRALFDEKPSMNGMIYNNYSILSRTLADGDFIRIDDGIETLPEGVLMVFSFEESGHAWQTLDIQDRQEISIGRTVENDIVLKHISVSKCHARITCEGGQWYIADCDSTNGVAVNNVCLTDKLQLHEKDIIVITNSKLIFTGGMIAYCSNRHGITVDAMDVVITRGKGRKRTITSNHVNVSIRPGELVAIIGGSGTGKSTILNAMSGYLPPMEGRVFINGIDLYGNFDVLKQIIGYVPQMDIVYDNLTLEEMLTYTAKLRLPGDVSSKERKLAIDNAIRIVELNEKRGSYIKSFSGGQRKRASIAVELLSDPKLLFLDEPASGLDPGTERNLMQTLRTMADEGKTVLLVTHSTLQLSMCDKIMFIGEGGNLCFFGAFDDALAFFGVNNIVDVYNMITENAPVWKKKYDSTLTSQNEMPVQATTIVQKIKKRTRQLPVLCARFARLVIHDRWRMLLLLLQAPMLALLISLVADGEQFNQYEMTKSLLFALSCSAFWVGMLNSIQEVCKERSIIKREYMTGMSLNAYILSKIIVLGAMCAAQSLLIVATFAATVGTPEQGVLMPPIPELFVTTALTAIAATAIGLFVSSLFNNADKAMTVAPGLLMPQILFSGLIFKLSGVTEYVSWLTICRWSVEGYGTTANLNELPLKLQQEGINLPHETETFFEFTKEHILLTWVILLGAVVVFLILARIRLSRIRKEAN